MPFVLGKRLAQDQVRGGDDIKSHLAIPDL